MKKVTIEVENEANSDSSETDLLLSKNPPR